MNPENISPNSTPETPSTPEAVPASPSPQTPEFPQAQSAPQAPPVNSAPPSQPVEQPAAPAVVVGGSGQAPQVFSSSGAGSQPELPAVKPKKSRRKAWIVSVVAALLIVAAPVFYFAYYMNPEVIYGRAMSNTSKGYDKLIEYTDKQIGEAKAYKGSGSFEYKGQGSAADGKFSLKNSGANNEATVDIGVQGTRYSLEVRSVKSDSKSGSPDVYIKAKGLKALDSLFAADTSAAAVAGAPATPSISSYEDKWVFIDHTLFDGLTSSQSESEEAEVKTPNREQIIALLKAVGEVNREYLLTDDSNKAIYKVSERVGKETVDGHKTYRYKLTFDEANYKKYVGALKEKIKSTSFYTWVKTAKYEKQYDEMFKSMGEDTGDLKKQKLDLWVDTGKSIIYKVGYQDAKTKDISDFGLDLNKKDVYSFFAKGRNDKDKSSGVFKLNVNTKQNNLEFTAEFKGDGVTASASFKVEPTKEKLNIEKPKDAVPYTEVLDALGLGGMLGEDASDLSTISDEL